MPSFRRVNSKNTTPGSGNLSDISKKPAAASDNSLPSTFIHPHHLYYLPPTPNPLSSHTPQVRKPSSQYNLKVNSDKDSNYTIDSKSSSRTHTRNNSLTNESIATSPTNSNCIFGSNSGNNNSTSNITNNNNSNSPNSTKPNTNDSHPHDKRPVLSHFFSSRKSRIASVSRASSPSQSEDDSSSLNSKDSHKSSFFSNHSGHRNRSNSQPQIDQSHISSFKTEEETSSLHTPRKSNTSPATHVTMSPTDPSNAFKITSMAPSSTAPAVVSSSATAGPNRTNSIMSSDSSLGYRRNSSTGSNSQDLLTTAAGFSNIIAGQPGGGFRKKSDVGLTPIIGGDSRSGSFSGSSTSPRIPNPSFQASNTPEAISGDALSNYYEKLATKQRNDSLAKDPLSPNLEHNPGSAQMSPKSTPATITTSVHPLSLSDSIGDISVGSSTSTTTTAATSINPSTNTPNPIITRSHSAESSPSPAPIRVPANRSRTSGSVSPLSTSLGNTTITGLSTTAYISKIADHLNLESSSSSSVFPPRKLSQVSQASQSSIGSNSPSKPFVKSPDSNSNKLIWDMFVKFVSNSRLSDSLIYAATRKEAWLQYSDTGFRNTHIIELWLMMALRFLFQNQLLFSPKAFDIISKPNRTVLDIQGVFKDHWAWQLAIDHPDSMVYGLKFDPSQANYSTTPNHEGPSNYIPFVCHSLNQLPFDDNFFDVISAKTLWYLLKSDQWEEVLPELFRILKPGGVIELLISDYVILNRSPIDHDLWDRYQQSVTDRNVETFPSHKCATRLKDSGFENIHRAMIALPRAWGGQIGQLTDLLSSYYTLSLVKYFGDFQQSEIDTFKYRSKHAAELHHYEAGSVHLFYATKPEVSEATT